MNRYSVALIVLLLPSLAYCAEQIFQHRPTEQYPAGLGFIPVHEILTTIEPIPAPIEHDLDAIFEKQGTYLIDRLAEKDMTIPLEEGSIYLSGLDARRKNSISSLGYDPYMNHPDNLPPFNGPVIHHCTIAIAQHLLKQSGSKTVIPAKTWLYHLKAKSNELDDKNYLLVQEQIPANFKQLSSLTEEQKKAFITLMDMDDFYTALRYIHYAHPSEQTIYVNTDDNTIMLPKTVSPDNEGLGLQVKYGKAILGQDLSKAKFNVRNHWDGGHKQFEAIVKEYGDTQDLQEWNACYQTDPALHN